MEKKKIAPKTDILKEINKTNHEHEADLGYEKW